MLFNSYVFILFFFPICLIGYFGLNHFKKYRWATTFLLIMSLWFYGYFNVSYLWIILSSIVVNFGIYKGFQKCTNKRKILLLIGLLFNIGLLFYFKYFNFFIKNMNAIFQMDWNLKNILLPLGISFFTFQQLSFLIDSYHNKVPKYSFIDYACFVTYFPQLIAGPIVTHDELIPQFMDEEKRKWNWKNFSMGIYIFVLGLAKKVLIADIFGNVVNYGFSNILNLNTTNAMIVMLSYTIQIYFDFSGYCDMAIGIGKMMNIDLPVNFNSPYKSFTIIEFWKRWHITLTRFFTTYVYIPLGGSKKGKFRTYLNVMFVFLVSGIWHGAAWTFIIWGLLHGIFSVITRHFKKWFDHLHYAFSWILTFGFINVTWVLFRANSLLDAFHFIKRILLLNFGSISSHIISQFHLPGLTKILNEINPLILKKYPIILMVLYFIFVFYIILNGKNAYERMNTFKPSYVRCVVLVILLLWCVISFTDISTFLYFNF